MQVRYFVSFFYFIKRNKNAKETEKGKTGKKKLKDKLGREAGLGGKGIQGSRMEDLAIFFLRSFFFGLFFSPK